MEAEGLNETVVSSFQSVFEALVGGASGTIPEASIDPVASLPSLAKDISGTVGVDTALLKETVVCKLNGGLGTSMGLDKAKSLLPVKGVDTFLDLTAKQVMKMREALGMKVRFMLMNSFSTSEDTLAFLDKYPALREDPNIELMQNKVPKVDKATMQPAAYDINPNLEWCPPGHGDLYAALYGSGKLDQLLAEGVKYLFVSNSDNLGATLDLELLSYFAQSGKPFLMECCQRTENDKKGGHLALRKADGQLILRESAMCADEDEGFFQDVTRHQFFNTNNLWVRLDRLKEVMDASGGMMPLPMIKNSKTVNPKDASSTPVFQLETAMGAAIESFAGAGAVVVPRTRFAPCKKCQDLFILRSDCYAMDESFIPKLDASRAGVAPVVSLDSKKYKLVQQLEAAMAGGVPSLVGCERLTVKGVVHMDRKCVFRGTVTVTNNSDEPKVLPPGIYCDRDVDLTDAPGLGPLMPADVETAPIEGQKPGTSGLRKKTRIFMEGLYLHNFVQSTFEALAESGTDVRGGTLLIGGDGRYYNRTAIQVICKIAAANGVRRIWIGQNGLLSTPAVSAIIRERGPAWQKAFGAFILTASHNPGGPDEDFGIKYNCENGGPAPDKLTSRIFAHTKKLQKVRMCPSLPEVDIDAVGTTRIVSDCGCDALIVEVVDSVQQHLDLLKTLFDFDAIRALVARPDFSMAYDSMGGVQGPYAHRILGDELGVPAESLMNATPKEDFGGGHADPNLTYAHQLTEVMGVDSAGNAVTGQAAEPPAFGGAADGDADRNMILGSRFFCSPSDSLAIIAAHADVIPYFRDQGGLKTVARSMPTSGALDLVAKRLNLNMFETPTGWKYFGNICDSAVSFGGVDYSPVLCGEESFGTGSDHIREKDGMFAILCWLQILAHYNKDAAAPFVGVEKIVRDHWASYGRNFYCRYDYEGVDAAKAEQLLEHLTTTDHTGTEINGFKVAKCDVFTYVDPIDGYVAKKQGWRRIMECGSRVVWRKSGTGSVGATIRMYIEKYEADASKQGMATAEALEQLVSAGLELSKLSEILGVSGPTVIT